MLPHEDLEEWISHAQKLCCLKFDGRGSSLWVICEIRLLWERVVGTLKTFLLVDALQFTRRLRGKLPQVPPFWRHWHECFWRIWQHEGITVTDDRGVSWVIAGAKKASLRTRSFGVFFTCYKCGTVGHTTAWCNVQCGCFLVLFLAWHRKYSCPGGCDTYNNHFGYKQVATEKCNSLIRTPSVKLFKRPEMQCNSTKWFMIFIPVSNLSDFPFATGIQFCFWGEGRKLLRKIFPYPGQEFLLREAFPLCF